MLLGLSPDCHQSHSSFKRDAKPSLWTSLCAIELDKHLPWICFRLRPTITRAPEALVSNNNKALYDRELGSLSSWFEALSMKIETLHWNVIHWKRCYLFVRMEYRCRIVLCNYQGYQSCKILLTFSLFILNRCCTFLKVFTLYFTSLIP